MNEGRFREWVRQSWGGQGPPSRWSLAAAAGILALGSFLVRSLYAVDLAPDMYTRAQLSTRVAARYDERALGVLRGEGALFPRHADPADTGLLARPPGYSLLLAALYAGLGRSFFTVQLVQNLLNSVGAAGLLLLATRLLGFRVGVVSGALFAVSPHLALSSNMILPDALCPLALIVAAVVLAAARPGPGFLARCLLAGVLLGGAAWLRPNMMLLAPLLAAAFAFLHRPGRRALLGAALVPLAAALTILPITLRNYLVYGEFVPISINGGLTLWEGVAEAGGQRYGARRGDKQVMEEEAERYGKPRYAEWWASPDGIWRDRDRVRRSLAVIRAHPLWYGRAMVRRVARMLDHRTEPPPLVAGGRAPEAPRPAADEGDEAPGGSPKGFEERGGGTFPPLLSDSACLSTGRLAAFLRPPLRAVQEASRSLMLPLVLAGVILVLVAEPRAALFLLAVPAYCLSTESLVLVEWRDVAGLYAFLEVFAAATLVAGTAGLGALLARARRRGADRRLAAG